MQYLPTVYVFKCQAKLNKPIKYLCLCESFPFLLSSLNMKRKISNYKLNLYFNILPSQYSITIIRSPLLIKLVLYETILTCWRFLSKLTSIIALSCSFFYNAPIRIFFAIYSFPSSFLFLTKYAAPKKYLNLNIFTEISSSNTLNFFVLFFVSLICRIEWT